MRAKISAWRVTSTPNPCWRNAADTAVTAVAGALCVPPVRDRSMSPLMRSTSWWACKASRPQGRIRILRGHRARRRPGALAVRPRVEPARPSSGRRSSQILRTCRGSHSRRHTSASAPPLTYWLICSVEAASWRTTSYTTLRSASKPMSYVRLGPQSMVIGNSIVPSGGAAQVGQARRRIRIRPTVTVVAPLGHEGISGGH